MKISNNMNHHPVIDGPSVVGIIVFIASLIDFERWLGHAEIFLKVAVLSLTMISIIIKMVYDHRQRKKEAK